MAFVISEYGTGFRLLVVIVDRTENDFYRNKASNKPSAVCPFLNHHPIRCQEVLEHFASDSALSSRNVPNSFKHSPGVVRISGPVLYANVTTIKEQLHLNVSSITAHFTQEVLLL